MTISKRSSQSKTSHDDEDSLEPSSNIHDNDNSVSTELEPQSKKARKGGPKFDEVWQYVIKGVQVNPGHYEATCPYCNNCWPRGKPCDLKAHLAVHCSSVPEDVRKY
ncbi:6715_t:CDS:1, partial [Cetraspora pellucida]